MQLLQNCIRPTIRIGRKIQCILYAEFLPDPRGAGLHEAFQFSFVRPSVRTYVAKLDFSFILQAQFTSDPQYFYRFRTSYVLTIRGADPKFPRPP